MSDLNTRRKYRRFFEISIQNCWIGALTLCVANVAAAGSLTEFGSFQAGAVPRDRGWESREGKPDSVYRIAEENGAKFLRASDQGQSVQLFRKVEWPIRKNGVLRWRWRVQQFPRGADERDGKTNDSAAAVYVVWPRWWFVPQVIKYVWSASVPAGEVITRSKWFSMIVLRSGEAPRGAWVEESRDVAGDFLRIFGRPAPDPVAVGFLTDANAVGGTAAADYGDLVSEPAPAQ